MIRYRWRRIRGPVIRYYSANMQQIAVEQGRPEPLRRWARRIARQVRALVRGRL